MAATHRLMVTIHRDSFSQMLLCSSDEEEELCEAVENLDPEFALTLLGEPTEIPPCSYAKHFTGLPGFDDWRANHEEFELFSSPVGVVRLEVTAEGIEGIFEKAEAGDGTLSLKLVNGELEYRLDAIKLHKADANLRAMILVALELLPGGRWKPVGTPEVVTPADERWPELITRSLRTL